MTDTAHDKVAELEAEVEHARAIAACSIGQPDRAENVAYREEMEAKLRAARAEAEKSTAREKVAETMWSEGKNLAAVSWNTCPKAIREAWLRKADAAIAAHLDALKADGYALVKLPAPACGPDGEGQFVWRPSVSTVTATPNDDGSWSVWDEDFDMTPDDAEELAAALLAAKATAEAQR